MATTTAEKQRLFTQVSYKLGAARAVENFTNWLQEGVDNPTEAPPKMAAVLAVKRVLEKLGAPRNRQALTGARASRTPAGSGSRLSAVKKKLSRQKFGRGKL